MESEPVPGAVKDPLDDGFFYPPAYVIKTWQDHERWGVYPDGGCYNDQPLTLLRDWDTLDRRYAEIYDHCKDLEPEDVWLPPTMQTVITEEAEAEPIAESNGLLARLRGLG